MSEFENGYYWVSYEDLKPIIMEKDKHGWNAFGVETEVDINNYKVLGKVSEWCNNEAKAELPLHGVSHSTAKLLDKLKKEIKEYDRFCFQLFSVRYNDAKPQDAWYDDYLNRYHKAKARIELLTELLE